MADSLPGTTTTLSQGGSDAFRALLNSVSPGAAEQLSPDAMQRLSEKVTQLVGGEDQARTILSGFEGGELVNEEGLPIIDISEQATDEPPQTELIDEPDVVHPAKLSPGEIEARRRERNRILDLLEAEEEELEKRQNVEEIEQRQEALRKRREAARKEAERLEAVKRMQKKMGKALLKGLDDAPEPVLPVPPKTTGPVKSVSFADEPEVSAKEPKPSPPQWGDVAQGRLVSSSRPTLLSQLRDDESLPMKLSVVERTPGVPQPPRLPSPVLIDSDDESEPPASDSDREGDESNPEADGELEEGPDFDYAQHQREIALKYHRMRSKMGQDVAETMKAHSHEEDFDMPIPPTRASLSRFKSERLTSAYNASAPTSSQSLGSAAVLPASGAETLRGAIRMGKLDDEHQLVAGIESEGSEDELQEVYDLIKKGDVYNAGPFGHALPVPQRTKEKQPEAGSSSTASLENVPPLPVKPRTSRFKASRPQAARLSETQPQSPQSESSTPVMTHGRSSPKLPQGEPPSFLNSPMQSTVVESPSFRAPAKGKFKMPSNLDEDYVPRTMDPMSMIVESPSFPRSAVPPASRPPTVMASTVGERKPPATPSPMMAGVVERNVMSAGVVERKASNVRPDRPPTVMAATGARERRPSRFMSSQVIEREP